MENQEIMINESEKCFACGVIVTVDEIYCSECMDKVTNKRLGKEKNGAVIKDNYRYSLTRVIDRKNNKRAVFWMLNPSTADANTDDLTIKRCIHFAKREKCGILEVVNLFAYRETNPDNLRNLGKMEAIGEENLKYITLALDAAAIVIVAWGENGKIQRRAKDPEITRLLDEYAHKIYCLGKTKDGHPRHPSRLRNDQIIINFRDNTPISDHLNRNFIIE